LQSQKIPGAVRTIAPTISRFYLIAPADVVAFAIGLSLIAGYKKKTVKIIAPIARRKEDSDDEIEKAMALYVSVFPL